MVAICVCICAFVLSLVSSAPIADEGEQESGYMNGDSNQIDYLRGKRLNNNVYAITPCAAAAAAAAAAAGNVARIPESAYANLVPAEPRYYVPSAYDYANMGYAGNMYRVEDPYRDARELLRFSDTNFIEQVPAGRLAYRTAPTAYVPLNSANIAGLNDQYNAPNAAASAYGIFPNANIGKCGVPLLFSCSPSVVTGQMVKPETQIYGSHPALTPGAVSPPDGYRGVDDHYVQRIHANQEHAMYDNLASGKKVTPHANEKS